VAINLNQNRAAIAVGKAARSSQDMRSNPSHGKGVLVLHVEGDHLWFGTGARPAIPDLGAPVEAQDEEEEEIGNTESGPADAEPEPEVAIENSKADSEVVDLEEKLAEDLAVNSTFCKKNIIFIFLVLFFHHTK